VQKQIAECDMQLEKCMQAQPTRGPGGEAADTEKCKKMNSTVFSGNLCLCGE
jgi:hypothetical protein